MRNLIKRIFSFTVCTFVLLSCCLCIHAQSLPVGESNELPIEQIITRTDSISEDGLVTTITFSNIQHYIEFVKQTAPETSDETIALEILDYCGYNDFKQSMSNSKLLEVLSFKSITRTAEYFHISPDVGTETISEQEALHASVEILTKSLLSISPLANDVGDSYVSDDGYMNLATYATAIESPITDTNPNHSYYIASAFSNWLIYPLQRYEDVLALSCGNAIFDMTYDNYAYAMQFDRCGYSDCNTAQREQWTEYALSGYGSFSSTRHDAGHTTYGTYYPENHISLIYPLICLKALQILRTFSPIHQLLRSNYYNEP